VPSMSIEQHEDSDSATKPVASRSHNQVLDGLRVVSIGGVLFIHVCAWALLYPRTAAATLLGSLSAGAVPAFFVISGYLWARSEHSVSDLRIIITRLGIPYVVWSAIYVLIGFVTSPHRHISVLGGLAIILVGQASWQLWFLPALAGCQLVGLWSTTPQRRVVALLLGIPILLVRASGMTLSPTASLVANYSTLGWLTAFFVGAWLSGLELRPFNPWAVRAIVLVCLVSLASTALPDMLGRVGSALSVVATIVLPSCVVADGAGGGDALGLSGLGRFAPLVFGVYLVHMVPIDILRSAWTPSQPVGPLTEIGIWVVVLAASVVMTMALRRTALGRGALGEFRTPGGWGLRSGFGS
jgi:surface polysaccharide O-acyltransferase-like enzyme